MTDSQFKKWLVYHLERFPTMRKHIGGKEHHGTQNAWRTVLRDVGLEMAMVISDDMHAGKLDHPDGFAWDRLPGIILSEASARRNHETRKAEHGQRTKPWANVTAADATMGDAYAEYTRLKAAGHSEDDCRCASSVLLGMATDDEQKRYDEIRGT